MRASKATRRLFHAFDMEIIGRDGRAAILREVAKGLQMPADEVVPSREKSAFKKREAQLAITPPDGGRTGGQQSPAPLDPSGAPQGGQQGNTVSNQITGRAV